MTSHFAISSLASNRFFFLLLAKEKTAYLTLSLLSGGQRPPADLVDAVSRLEKRCFSRTDAWDGEGIFL
jgi:hypothetical protein